MRNTHFGALVKSRYSKYSKFLKDIISSIQRRFEPWPDWLKYCNDAFNFKNELTIGERKESLRVLMELPSAPVPLLTEEKNRICSEFVTLTLNADNIIAKKTRRGIQSY